MNDSKIRIKTALDKIVSKVQVNYTNRIVAKIKRKIYHGALGYSYRSDYWAIIERVPVRFLSLTLWHKDRILISTDYTTIYNGGSMFWDIYDRKIVDTAADEINKLSAHYPKSYMSITKHFRPNRIEPGHLISEDVLL